MSPIWLFLAAGSGLLLGFVVGVNMGYQHAKAKISKQAADNLRKLFGSGLQFEFVQPPLQPQKDEKLH